MSGSTPTLPKKINPPIEVAQSQNSFFVPFSYMYINSKCHTESNKITMIYSSYYIKTSFLFTIKDRSAIYLVKKKIMKNVPVQVIFTGKNQ